MGCRIIPTNSNESPKKTQLTSKFKREKRGVEVRRLVIEEVDKFFGIGIGNYTLCSRKYEFSHFRR